ncbi:MAG: SGNH/GDSL hydrolase family protein [Polaromonas sp.]|uniref:SGNH/GDSL hydrolase family protein n=1 Tax=Polaromonas sp. TaxID=1869339 RepID=UPI00273695E6|nr:SGNH/GDSL hydrolase family protein [Polaromonas sp.]MDP2819885.1 SGNH/GDSL hydrolase family protein [Polaromonas sp.]
MRLRPTPQSARGLWRELAGGGRQHRGGHGRVVASLAGLIARDHPSLKIVNRAKDGAKLADIARQLDMPGDERFDAILVLGGGNDVIRLTPASSLEENIARVAALARTQARLVVLMPSEPGRQKGRRLQSGRAGPFFTGFLPHSYGYEAANPAKTVLAGATFRFDAFCRPDSSGNVGSAPFFFPPWSWLMTQRSKTLHRFVREVASDNGALYVNLYKDKPEDPFAQRPDELNAKDGLHPSDAGYRLWYAELNTQVDFSRRLAALAR